MSHHAIHAIVAVAVLSFSVLGPPVQAQDNPSAQERADLRDRFQLFTRCNPLGISVYVQGDKADEIELTEERVRTMAESRLRAARLYGSHKGVPSLAVTILTLDDGPAFVRRIQLSKWLRDDMTELALGIFTWEDFDYGTHGGDAGFIMQGLSEDLDGFILEYLRVNEGYC